MNVKEAKAYLDSFINYELDAQQPYVSFKLERVQHLLSFLGNPQRRLKSIHVAGTKGKGSTCAFAAYILKEAGYRVGLYTSPHLHDCTERIRVLDLSNAQKTKNSFAGKISHRELCCLLKEIKPKIEKAQKESRFGRISFFEVYTALAFCYFQKKKIDIAVLETGLGGRLDATNVVSSLVCGITPLSLEHTQQLGSTIAKIAKEKAAIIKNKKQIVVIAPQERKVFEVIEERCRKVKAKTVFVGSDLSYESVRQNGTKQIFHIKGLRGEYRNLKTGLLGQHQLINATMAVGMVEALYGFGFSVSGQHIKKGIERTQWPGRMEIVRKNPTVILDGAHNVSSSRALAKAIQDIFPKKKVILMLGVSGDKDIAGICKVLNPISRRVILTEAFHPRAHRFSPPEVKSLFSVKDVTITQNTREALGVALKRIKKTEVVLVAGSLFVVGEIRRLCLKRD